MKTSDSVTRYPRLTSSAAGAFAYEATGDPSAFIEIFADRFIITGNEFEDVALVPALPRKRTRTATGQEPNEVSREALEQWHRGELNTYESLEAFREHLRSI